MTLRATSLPIYRLLLAGGFVLSLAACGDEPSPDAGQDPAAPAATGATTLAIDTAVVEPASGVPLASVPGRIALPPEARVAVTPPFAGVAVRVYVIEGEYVARGAPLALVRAAEPIAISGDLARARSELALAQAQAERVGQLADEGIVASARAQEAEARLQQARATLAQAQRLNALSGTGADGTMTLRSPIAGRIAHVGIETGAGVDGTQAPFVIEAAGPLRIELQVPERLAQQVRPGMGISLQLPGAEGEDRPVGGRILTVAPSIDPQTRSVLAVATVSAAPGLVPGANVTVAIAGPDVADGMAVPISALTRIDGEDHVFVKDGADFVPRPVVVAASAGGRAVIAEGLAEGEVVATSSVTELKAAAAE